MKKAPPEEPALTVVNAEVKRLIVPGPPPSQEYKPPVPVTALPPDIETRCRLKMHPLVDNGSIME